MNYFGSKLYIFNTLMIVNCVFFKDYFSNSKTNLNILLNQ